MPDRRDALDEIRSQVEAAHDAAERLVRDAEQTARSRFEDVPPNGWASEEPPRSDDDELRAISALLELARDALRSTVPPELRDQLIDALRQLLQALRALIDWYLQRLDAPRPRTVDVEDIPID